MADYPLNRMHSRSTTCSTGNRSAANREKIAEIRALMGHTQAVAAVAAVPTPPSPPPPSPPRTPRTMDLTETLPRVPFFPGGPGTPSLSDFAHPRYKTTIPLPRNLTLITVHPLTEPQVEALDHVQVLRLWEVLTEMRDEPLGSAFLDWKDTPDGFGFDTGVWKEKILTSVKAVERVLREKWGERVEDLKSLSRKWDEPVEEKEGVLIKCEPVED